MDLREDDLQVTLPILDVCEADVFCFFLGGIF